MTRIEQKPQINGPYGDLFTRNLVLQVMSEDKACHLYEYYDRRDMIESNLEKLLKEPLPEGADPAKKLMEILEKKGKAFQHTTEYYAAIRDERKRMKAYRDLKVVSTIPYGEDAEIEADPFKFLYLPPEATFAQVRDAWIRLSKKWYPDLMYPENQEQFERIFGTVKLPVGIEDSSLWAKQIMAYLPPETHDTEGVEKLSLQEREEYQKQHQAHREKELEYERVKAEMRRRATEKMQIINKAYAAARKRFSKEEMESFAGFEWQKQALSALEGHFRIEYEVLDLEGNGQLRKNRGTRMYEDLSFFESDDNQVYLAFDFGDIYLADQHEYRQSLPLKEFFAWTELKQNKGLCPTLLNNLVKTYKLDDDRAEQLRTMIINNESPEFIIAALSIPTDNLKHYDLLRFLDFVYEGPTFYHQTGPREEVYFPLGVEFTPNGQLTLKYEAQEEQVSFFSRDMTEKQVAQFSPQDVQIMRAMAYGPLLKEPE